MSASNENGRGEQQDDMPDVTVISENGEQRGQNSPIVGPEDPSTEEVPRKGGVIILVNESGERGFILTTASKTDVFRVAQLYYDNAEQSKVVMDSFDKLRRERGYNVQSSGIVKAAIANNGEWTALWIWRYPGATGSSNGTMIGQGSITEKEVLTALTKPVSSSNRDAAIRDFMNDFYTGTKAINSGAFTTSLNQEVMIRHVTENLRKYLADLEKAPQSEKGAWIREISAYMRTAASQNYSGISTSGVMMNFDEGDVTKDFVTYRPPQPKKVATPKPQSTSTGAVQKPAQKKFTGKPKPSKR
jgi:hypothetical protein